MSYLGLRWLLQEERENEEHEKSELYVELDITREKNEELKLDNGLQLTEHFNV